jgi:hypothetical protein
MRTDRDILWKGIIEEVFDDLLRFVFPDADEVFDMQRKFGFLDKELGELYPEPGKPSATRLVDKLVKVYRRDGGAEWLLVHIEVQGKSEEDFPERMFRYYYRIFDRWRHPVTAVAILIDANGHRIPDRYEHQFLGTELIYKYNVLRVWDMKEEVLSKSKNPFATVLLIARNALFAKKMSDEVLLEFKLMLFNTLISKRGLSQEKVAAIIMFLNNYLVFKSPEINHIFKERTEQKSKKNNPMGILVEMFKEELKEEIKQGMWDHVKVKVREQFREEFIKEEREKIALTFIVNTEFSDDKIASLVDLPVTEVERLRHERQHK